MAVPKKSPRGKYEELSMSNTTQGKKKKTGTGTNKK
jgi:hypothetical protein